MNEKIEFSAIVKQRTMALTLVLGAASLSFAQQKVPVAGRVADNQNASIPYASVTFSNKANKLLSDAVLTNEKGNYSIELAPGNYEVVIEAIDFKTATFTKNITATDRLNFTLQRESAADAAKNTQEIQGVVITASSKALKVEIDKKTYDVKSDLTAVGGNLQDVLQNVPSVSVDPDGTVSMRGSSNVKFLVNGKPSALLGIDDGANALQAIPADQIDRIEVITNPSAKFDASGTAGILNIILKKNSKLGFNGSAVGSVGYLPRTSLNTNLNWRKGKLSWFANGGGGYSESKGKNWNDTTFDISDAAGNKRIYLSNRNKTTGKNYNGSTGLVYDISDKTSVNASITARAFDMENRQPILYTYYPMSGTPYPGSKITDGDNKNNGIQGDFGFDQKLDDKGQSLSLSLSLQRNKSEGNSSTNEIINNIFKQANNTTQENLMKSLVGKADYEKPFGENSMLNAGYKVDANNNQYTFGVQTNTPKKNGFSTLGVEDYNNNTEYREQIHAGYIQYKSKIGNFGYQLGLRDELSNISIDYHNLSGKNNLDNKEKNYNDLFPSVFLSYDFSKNNQLLLNYSRRIDRPRSFFLVPYMQFADSQNIFRGNPDLNPAYIDSFEVGYNISKKKFSLNPTIYFKKENDDVKMTVVYDRGENTFYTQPNNLGYDQRIGLDINFTYDPFPWWKLLGEIDLYHYKTSGDYDYLDSSNETKHINYDGSGGSTRLRLSSTFKIDKTFSIQLLGNYRGAQKEGANDQRPMYFVNVGASKTIWKGDGTVSFNMQDLFNTRTRHVISFGDGFSRETMMQWQPQQASLSLTYRFKQGEKITPPKRKRDINANEGGDDQMPPM